MLSYRERLLERYPLKEDLDEDMDISFGEEYRENYMRSAVKTVNAIKADVRLERLFHTIMTEALEEGATDIHIGRYSDVGLVRLRVDKLSIPYRLVDPDAIDPLILKMKTLSEINPEPTRKPQDGQFNYYYKNINEPVRLAVINAIDGMKVTLRLRASETLDWGVDDLNLPETILRTYKRLLHAGQGVILICGPTSSGKSTTLYAGANEVVRTSEYTKEVYAIEQPVEIHVDGINQISVVTDEEVEDLNYKTAVVNILRQDPDVMIVGEIREEQTAKQVLRSSTSGHLTLTTMHLSSVFETFNVLNQLGVAPIDIDTALVAVMAQRLERQLCQHCKLPKLLDIEEKKWIDSKMGAYPQLATIFKANQNGCEHCRNGYSGSTLLMEMLETDEMFRVLKYHSNGDMESLKRTLLESAEVNYYPMEESVYTQLKAGLIDLDVATKLINH